MPDRDVFAFDRSGFNGFLFAPIGTEADGSRLTVLSALARLGEDPWAKAAIWALMRKADASEGLAGIIAQMPVTREDQLAAPETAARLVLLLSPAATTASVMLRTSAPLPKPRLALIVAAGVCAAVLLSGAFLMSRQEDGNQVPPAEPSSLNTP